MKKKVVALVLVIALCAGLLTALIGCNKDIVTKKDKAIIYVTALFTGGLYDSQTNTALWEPFSSEFELYDYVNPDTSLNFEGILEAIKDSDFGVDEDGEPYDLISYALNAIEYKKGNLLWDLTLDQDGNGNNPNVIPANNFPKDKNGKVMDISNAVFGIYKPFIDEIKEVYGDEYEVETFNYDWRYSPADAGKKLEEYINHWGYKEVILMSHSMGGPTVASYLARSQANRDKVKLYMGFAPATMGSFDALCALTCIDEYVKNFVAGMDLDESLLTMLKGIIEGALTYGGLGDFIYNNQGLMTLCPSWQLYDSEQYGDGEYGIYIDGNPITTKEGLYDFYESLPWALYYNYEKDEDGEVIDKTTYENWSGEYKNKDGQRIKEAVATLEDYYDSFYLDGEYVVEKVNSYYFVGTGLDTTITQLNVTTNGSTNSEDWSYEIVTGYGSARMGDGTVPHYASVGGLKDNEIRDYDTRVIKYDGRNHMDVGASIELLSPQIFKLLEETIGY